MPLFMAIRTKLLACRESRLVAKTHAAGQAAIGSKMQIDVNGVLPCASARIFDSADQRLLMQALCGLSSELHSWVRYRSNIK